MDTKFLDQLVEELNEEGKQCEEFDTSEDSTLAEFVSDLGYNECEYDTKHLTDEARASLDALPSPKLARQAVLECSHVELVGMFYQTNEVFSAHLGEGQYQLDGELLEKMMKLTVEEFEYVAKHTEVCITERHRDLIFINHGDNRWVLILDEEKLANWKPKKVTKVGE